MGSYRCPRCGSTDSYVGNVMLAKPGGYISHELGDTGAMGTVPIPGGHKVVPARKCKPCGEILSESNLEKSPAEVAEERQEQQRRAANMQVAKAVVVETGASLFFALYWVFSGIVALILGVVILMLFLEGNILTGTVMTVIATAIGAFQWYLAKLFRKR